MALSLRSPEWKSKRRASVKCGEVPGDYAADVTAGGLVFTANMDGNLVALMPIQARSSDPLAWNREL
jgi:hypothetical protein